MLFQCSQHSFIPLLSSVSIMLSIPCIWLNPFPLSNSTRQTSRSAGRELNPGPPEGCPFLWLLVRTTRRRPTRSLHKAARSALYCHRLPMHATFHKTARSALYCHRLPIHATLHNTFLWHIPFPSLLCPTHTVMTLKFISFTSIPSSYTLGFL